jgi:hypothetical protein
MVTLHVRGSLYEVQEVISKIEHCVTIIRKFKINLSHIDDENGSYVYEQEIQVDLYAGVRS